MENMAYNYLKCAEQPRKMLWKGISVLTFFHKTDILSKLRMKEKRLFLLCFGAVSWCDFSRQSIPRKVFRINNDWAIIGKMKCTPEKQIILFSCSAPQEPISCRKDFRKHIAYISHLISSCFPLTSDLGPCLWQWFCYISC